MNSMKSPCSKESRPGMARLPSAAGLATLLARFTGSWLVGPDPVQSFQRPATHSKTLYEQPKKVGRRAYRLRKPHNEIPS